MSRSELVAILAAIIYAGADNSEGPAGYSAKTAVERAIAILSEAEGRDTTMTIAAAVESVRP